MDSSGLITVDPDFLGGTPVFKGTRVPVKTLFDYLADNYTLDELLECFPSVTREVACRALERSESALLDGAAALMLLLDETAPQRPRDRPELLESSASRLAPGGFLSLFACAQDTLRSEEHTSELQSLR